VDEDVKALVATPVTKCSPDRSVTRIPLAAAAMAFVLGIAAGLTTPMTTGFWMIIGAVALAGAVGLSRMRHLHLAAMSAALVAVLAIGAVHVRFAYGSIDENHIATFTPNRSILATVRGHVVTAPKVIKSGLVGGYPRPDRTNFILDADSISAGGTWPEVSGLVRVSIDSTNTNLLPGQRVELIGTIGRFKEPDNPGQMDWSQYARRTRVFVQMSAPSDQGATVIDKAPLPWVTETFWRLRAATRQHLLACGDSDQGDLLGALILGERDPALRSLNDTMARAGIAHFISISGLHVGVFLWFVYFICSLMQFTPRRSAIIVLIVLGIYLMLAETRAPLLRAAIMATAFCISIITHRRYTSLNALAAAAIILLTIDPLQILSAGFQLSFAIVAGLIILHAPLQQFLFGRWLSQRGLMVFRSDQRVSRWIWFTLGNSVTGIIAMCLAAYLVAAPLVAFHFGLFSPYAPLLSILVFPLVLAVLVPGYIAIALAWPAPNLAASIRQIALAAADLLASAVQMLEHLPLLSIDLRPVGAIWTLLCYATITMVFFSQRVRFGRAMAAVMLIATIALGVHTQRTAEPPPPGSAQLDMLDVGAGQCVLLTSPSGQTHLIDAGTRSGSNLWPQVLKPFLRAQRLPTPAGAFISHANTDHYNALLGLVAQRRLNTIYLNDYFGRDDPLPEFDGKLMNLLVDRGVRIVRLRAGDEVQLEPDILVETLWPPASKPTGLSTNDRSLLLRITCGGRRILFPGDLSQAGQTALLASGIDIQADIFVLPHHGSWTKSLPKFLQAVSPKIVLQSASYSIDRRQTPSDEQQEFILNLRRDTKYLSTAKDGWIRLNFSKEGTIRTKTMRSPEN
jgi:competence protein ComEC